MKRRRFLLSTVALAGLSNIAPAQSPPKAVRIGWIIGGSAAGSELFLEALRAGLADLGYVEGRNLWSKRVTPTTSPSRCRHSPRSFCASRSICW